MKKYILFTLFLFSSSILMAQTAIFEGKVLVKETKETIPFAQVILRNKTDSSLVAFSSADENGIFKVTTTFGTYILEVRSVGYITKIQSITIDKKKFEFDIFLQEDIETLKQVEVIDSSPITQNNDTLSFNAEDFSAAGDEKLEDIVKKIPHLEVNNNGEIFYKGKQIEDIEIEGESLFKQSPQTINRSLPADVVDKIQIIEGKSWDENPKLNIKIKEDKKNIVFGEFTAFGGINNQEKTAYRIQSNAFYINPKLKMMALVDGNNVGKHLFDLHSYLSFTGNSFSSVRSQNVKDLPLQQTAPEIPPQTQTLFGGLSAVYTISKKFKIKSYSFYNQKKESYLSETIRNFTENSIGGSYQNTQNQSQNKGFLSSKVSLLFSPSISQNLTTHVDFHSLTSSIKDENEIIFLSTENLANQQIKLKNPEWNLSTFWTKTINPKNQINLSATYHYLIRNRGLNLQNTQDVFSNTFSKLGIDISSITLQNIVTQTNQTYHNYELKGNFRRLLKEKTYLGIEIQTENQNQNQVFFSEKVESIDKLNPTSDYSIQRNSGSAFFELENPKIQFRTWLTLANYNYNFEGKINQVKINEFQFEGKLDFSFMVTSSQRLNLNYQRKNEYPNSQNLNQVWHFENFRTIQNGTNSLAKMTTDEVKLGYNYTNLFNRLMIYGSLSHQKISNAITQNQFIFAEANVQTDINVPNSITTGLVYITKSFDIKEIPFSAKTQFVWNRLESQNFLNEIKNEFINSFTKYQIDLNSHSKGIFNISISSFFQQNNLNSSLNSSLISLNQYQFLINPVIQPTEKFNFSFSYEQLFYQNSEKTTTFGFLNTKASYQIFKRTNLKLEGYNLLNMNTIDFLSITPIYTQMLSRQILGRVILLGLNYNF